MINTVSFTGRLLTDSFYTNLYRKKIRFRHDYNVFVNYTIN